jgi:hypothetical protein
MVDDDPSWGTEGSNPSPSVGESATNRAAAGDLRADALFNSNHIPDGTDAGDHTRIGGR